MKNVVITTTTKYNRPDELRFRLAMQMVASARAAGYPVVVVDGSPNKFVCDRLRSLGAFVYRQNFRGMGAAQRQAFFHSMDKATALELQIILRLEPEKVDLIRFIPEIVAPIERGEADIILPCRSKKSWQTYPKFQCETEREINKVYNETVVDHLLIGDGDSVFDPAFGPIAFRRKFARHFIECDGRTMTPPISDNYITQYAPLFAVLEENARVATVEVDFQYPPEQRAEEEGALLEGMKEKRRCQREEIIQGYQAVMKTLNVRAAEESD